MMSSEADPSRIRITDPNPGTFQRVLNVQRTEGTVEPKHPSNIRNYESALKGIESLNFKQQ